MFDIFREIGQTLRNNRLRTILTGISVAWGIFMLIILLGAARGTTNYFEEATAGKNNNIITIWSGWTTMPYKGYESGRDIRLKQADGDAIIHDNRSIVSRVSPFGSVDTAKISTALDVISGGFDAVFPDAALNEQLTIKHGRFINQADIDGARRVMILSDRNARRLFKNDSLALGKTVKCLDLAWTVVGVFTHRWKRGNYVPYTAYKAVTGNNDEAYQLDVTVEGLESTDDGDAAERNIRATLSQRHSFSPDDESAVYTWNRFNNYLRNKAAGGYLEIAVWVIGFLTLLTGIVGVSNIMFVSVRERTHEIGIRRAIGAKPRSILFQIIAEGVATTALFGYIGVFAGMVVLQILNGVIGDMEGFRNPTVDISIAIKVTIALILAGIFAGLFPALKATKVKPVEALRDE